MTWYDVDPALRRQVEAGEPAALRQFVEDIAAAYGITIHYTADPLEWRSVRNEAHGPPAVDKIAAAILVHELSHNIAGPCPRTGLHRARIVEDRTLQCLACEHKAWDIATRLMPFDQAMHARMRKALGSYRSGTPAPVSVQIQSDRFMGTVSWAERRQKARQWEDKVARQEAAKASLARDMEKRRKFEAMEARLDRARSS